MRPPRRGEKKRGLFATRGPHRPSPIGLTCARLLGIDDGVLRLADLDLLVGYALDGSRRFSTSGGDSPLGNMIATAAWLRVPLQIPLIVWAWWAGSTSGDHASDRE